ncbi:hypothetical protein CBR_g3569 [Chara braunii]|uniref:Uncharacterized protein n=1 Tax=Chara braunii TaxID=69332 RepID=A0A388KFN9_CHABU|nr:hypothetical protein CBR_g3569 [Chara braunii]|eukprot:GBG68872.1 hypothetical protein CBR_g3569 [Chara braunii]
MQELTSGSYSNRGPLTSGEDVLATILSKEELSDRHLASKPETGFSNTGFEFRHQIGSLCPMHHEPSIGEYQDGQQEWKYENNQLNKCVEMVSFTREGIQVIHEGEGAVNHVSTDGTQVIHEGEDVLNTPLKPVWADEDAKLVIRGQCTVAALALRQEVYVLKKALQEEREEHARLVIALRTTIRKLREGKWRKTLEESDHHALYSSKEGEFASGVAGAIGDLLAAGKMVGAFENDCDEEGMGVIQGQRSREGLDLWASIVYKNCETLCKEMTAAEFRLEEMAREIRTRVDISTNLLNEEFCTIAENGMLMERKIDSLLDAAAAIKMETRGFEKRQSEKEVLKNQPRGNWERVILWQRVKSVIRDLKRMHKDESAGLWMNQKEMEHIMEEEREKHHEALQALERRVSEKEARVNAQREQVRELVEKWERERMDAEREMEKRLGELRLATEKRMAIMEGHANDLRVRGEEGVRMMMEEMDRYKRARDTEAAALKERIVRLQDKIGLPTCGSQPYHKEPLNTKRTGGPRKTAAGLWRRGGSPHMVRLHGKVRHLKGGLMGSGPVHSRGSTLGHNQGKTLPRKEDKKQETFDQHTASLPTRCLKKVQKCKLSKGRTYRDPTTVRGGKKVTFCQQLETEAMGNRRSSQDQFTLMDSLNPVRESDAHGVPVEPGAPSGRRRQHHDHRAKGRTEYHGRVSANNCGEVWMQELEEWIERIRGDTMTVAAEAGETELSVLAGELAYERSEREAAERQLKRSMAATERLTRRLLTVKGQLLVCTLQ